MPAPLIHPAIAVATAATAFALRPLLSSFGQLFSPLELASQQAGLSQCPVVLPDVQTLIQLARYRDYKDGTIPGYIPTFLAFHGVALKHSQSGLPANCRQVSFGFLPEETVTAMERLWEKVYEFTRTRPEISTAISLYLSGQITKDELNDLLAYHGAKSDEWQEVIKYMHAKFTFDELTYLWNRGVYNEQQVREALKRLQFNSEVLSEGFRELEAFAKYIPGVSDLVRFALREVFSKDVVDRYGYDQEFPLEFQYWAEKLGYGWKLGEEAKFTPLPPGMDPELTWARAYWRAHWEVPSPTQAYEMLHRLRPSRIHIFRAAGLDVKPFTVEDVRTILKIHDYAPAFRDQLAAISYNVITRVDARRMYELGVIPNKAELAEVYMDMGYNEQDAKNLAEFTDRQIVKRKTSPAVKAIVAQYVIGTIQFDDAVARLVALGIAEVEARVILSSARTIARTRALQQSLNAIRQSYLRGAITDARAVEMMVQIGIAGDVALEHIRDWEVIKTLRVREVSTAQLMSWYVEGIIGVREFRERLQNLGWSTSDVTRIVSQANIKIARILGREIEKAMREAERRQREAERRQRIRPPKPRPYMTPGLIRRWAKEKLVTIPWVRDRLQELGWRHEDIDLFVEELLREEQEEAEEE